MLANKHESLRAVPHVQDFVDRVAELSRGSVTVRVENRWNARVDEPSVLRDVADGEADLGWVGTRALDLVGITTFTPLHAPSSTL